MCKLLGISRSLIYYQRKNKREDIELENTANYEKLIYYITENE